MSHHGHCKGLVVSATEGGAAVGSDGRRCLRRRAGDANSRGGEARPTIEISSHTDDEGRPVLKVVIDGIPRKKLDPERVQR